MAEKKFDYSPDSSSQDRNRPWAAPGSDETKYDNSASPDSVKAKKPKKELSDAALANMESGVTALSGNATAKSGEEEKTSKGLLSRFRADQKKRKSRFSRRQKIGIGLSTGGIGVAGFFGFGFFSGPIALVHFSQSLQSAAFFDNENFGNDRSSRITTLYRYARTGTVQGTRLGAISSRRADTWDRRMAQNAGVRIVYDRTTGGMAGLEVLDEVKARGVIKQLEADGININTRATNVNAGRVGDAVSGRTISIRDTGIRAENKVRAIKSITSSLDINGISTAVGNRTLIKLSGVTYHPITRLRKAATETANLFRLRKQDARDTNLRNGTADVDIRSPNAATDTDADGNTTSPDGSVDAVDGANREIADASDARSNGRLSRFRNSFATKFAGGTAAVIGVMCVAKDLGNQAEELQFAQTILPLMRTAVEAIAVGAQIQAGQDLSFDEVGYYASLLFDEETGLGVTAAAAAQFEAGQPVTGPDIESAVKPDNVNGKPLLFDILDQIPGLGTTCGIDEFVAGIPVIGDITEAANTLSTGAIDVFLETTFNTNSEDLITSLVAWIAGAAVDTGAQGAKLGNYAYYGARLAANSFALATGGRELSAIETGELHQRKLAILEYENSQKSTLDRYFDLNDHTSFASRTLQQTNPSPTGLATSLLNAPQALMSKLGIFSSVASAQVTETGFDYGFSAVGFSVAEQDNPLVADPYLNAQSVEPRLAELTEAYGSCFPVTVTIADGAEEAVLTVDSYTDEDTVTQFSNDDTCNDPANDELLQYRMYLADTVTAKSLDCYEGGETSCEEIGFNAPLGGGGATAAGGTTLNAPGLNGYAIPCTGQPTPVIRIDTAGSEHVDWTGVRDSGVIGTDSSGNPIKVYIREACDTSNPRTVLIVGSVHGSENGGGLVGHELLFNRTLPDDVRIIVIPEINKTGIDDRDNGGVNRGGYFNYGRVNANGVNLNRNNDYRWSSMNDLADHTTPGASNYRGASPNSEPETQAVQGFITALGNTDLSIHYHDNIFYVAPVGNTSAAIAQAYADGSGMHGQCFDPPGNPSTQNCAIRTVNQRGSLDGWQAATIGDPVLLVELSSDLSNATIQRNVDAVISITQGSLLR